MIRDSKKTVYDKILLSFVSAVILIIVVGSLGNFYVLRKYSQSAIAMYESTLELYGNYWEQRLKSVDRSVLTMAGPENGQAYEDICAERTGLTAELGKIDVVDTISKYANIYENQFRYFVYIPQYNLYLQSANRLGTYSESESNEKFLRENMEKIQKSGGIDQWGIYEIDNIYYLIHAYHMNSGYVGAMIKCDTIFDYITKNGETMEAAAIIDTQGDVVYCSDEAYEKKPFQIYSQALERTDYRIGVIVPGGEMRGDEKNLILIVLCSLLACMTVVFFSIRFQKKEVYSPLKRLNVAMEKFSQGDMDFRLRDFPENHEVKSLFMTFNHMAEEIKTLKIDVYENELEKQKIQNQYFRVQIQPHFYSNILNLIYSLAEIKDYESIQDLSLHLIGYFRYLLSTKDDFVTLARELQCIHDYIEIQRIRYLDCLEIQIDCPADAGKILVLPLLLQTFVENSIKHNILVVPKLMIRISIEEEGGYLNIVITDNGVGFPEGVKELLLQGKSIEEHGKHIGIENIRQRIELLYSKKGILELKNLEKGAEVRITVPAKWVE